MILSWVYVTPWKSKRRLGACETEPNYYGHLFIICQKERDVKLWYYGCVGQAIFVIGVIMMKRPLDEREMQELLELAKDAEQKALETSELATAIALKYLQRMGEVREARMLQETRG